MDMPTRVPSSGAWRAFAWLGGVAFVGALAYCAYFFLVRIAVPGPGRPGVAGAVAWNVLWFTLFAGHHSLMARSGAKALVGRTVPPALERSTYVWIASGLLILVCAVWQRVPGLVYSATGLTEWTLWIVQLVGVGLTVGGARVLDPLELAGIRQASGAQRPSEIRVVWPYTFVRHPLYLGWALIVFGAPAMTVDRLVWATTTTVYLVIAIPWEERSLFAAAGPAYQAYRRQVRWRMVPGVY